MKLRFHHYLFWLVLSCTLLEVSSLEDEPSQSNFGKWQLCPVLLPSQILIAYYRRTVLCYYLKRGEQLSLRTVVAYRLHFYYHGIAP